MWASVVLVSSCAATKPEAMGIVIAWPAFSPFLRRRYSASPAPRHIMMLFHAGNTIATL